MPTVTYKCGKTGKTKKKTFAYNAVGKAQSTEFAKLMGGSKKNNPGPGEEVMSTKNRAAKRAAKKTGVTTATAKKATAMKKAPTKKKIKHDNKGYIDAMVASRQPKTKRQMTTAKAYKKALSSKEKRAATGTVQGAKGGAKRAATAKATLAAKAHKKAKAKTNKKFTEIQKGVTKGLKKADNKARADYRKVERKKRGGDMRPLIGSGRVKRAKQVVKRNKALKRK